jgi:hypothetical protein
MPDGAGSHHQGHFPARGGGARRGGPPNGHAFRVIEEKFAAMAVQEVNFSYSTVIRYHLDTQIYGRMRRPNKMVREAPVVPIHQKVGVVRVFHRAISPTV